MNRLQAWVLALFALYWVAIVVILLAARDVYDSQLPPTLIANGNPRSAEIGTLLVLTLLLALFSTGVVRGWRWIFWVILVVFLAGIVHVLTTVLQLARVTPPQGPAWYVLFQGIVGLLQFAIALAMLAGWRRGGIWGTP